MSGERGARKRQGEMRLRPWMSIGASMAISNCPASEPGTSAGSKRLRITRPAPACSEAASSVARPKMCVIGRQA